LQHREQPPGLWKSRSGVAGGEVRVGQRQNALGEAKPDQLGDAPPVAPRWDAPRKDNGSGFLQRVGAEHGEPLGSLDHGKVLERPVGGRPAQRSGDGDRLSVLDFLHGRHVGSHDPQLFGNRVEVGPGTAVEVPRQHRDGHQSLLHLGRSVLAEHAP
jgi:hypothetical protein